MFTPFHVVGVTNDEITYEFKTIYVCILYGIVLVGAMSLLFRQQLLGILAAGWMVLYFFTVSVQYRRLGLLTKRAMAEGSVRASGSKWSFKNPLRVTIPRFIGEVENVDQPPS